MTEETTREELNALIDKIVTQWADKGKVIEGGWQAYVATSGLDGAPEMQRQELHTAFFLGAQHLFASIMGIMEADTEPTEKDFLRLGLINEELEAFRASVLQANVGRA